MDNETLAQAIKIAKELEDGSCVEITYIDYDVPKNK